SLGEFLLFAKGRVSTRRTTSLWPPPFCNDKIPARRTLPGLRAGKGYACTECRLSNTFSDIEWRARNFLQLLEDDLGRQLDQGQAFFGINVEDSVGGDNLVHALSAG